MKYCSENQKTSEIIKNYIKEKNRITITYMDNSKKIVINVDNDYEEEIKKKMINQLIERNNDYIKAGLDKKLLFQLLCCISLSVLLAVANAKENEGVFFSSLVTLVVLIYKTRTTRKKIEDIKKTEMFIKMFNDINDPKHQNVYDSIEPDHIYQIPLTINSIDQYSYSDIKTMYKVYNNNKKRAI